jgi:DDE family transposase
VTPPLITPVLTTTAPVDDSHPPAAMHAALETKGLLPQRHLVETGDGDAARLAVSQRGDAINLCGAVRGRVRWQAHTEGAGDLSRLVIDWDQRQVTCPAGHTSLGWTPAIDNRDHAVITITLARGDCGDCPYCAPCTRTARRSLTLRPQEPHEARLANRRRQATAEFQAEQARRCGIEGTRSYGTCTCGMRQARDLGLAKTHLQPWASAAGMNLARLVRWLSGEPRAHTRQTPFQKWPQAAAESSPSPSKIRQRDHMW